LAKPCLLLHARSLRQCFLLSLMMMQALVHVATQCTCTCGLTSMKDHTDSTQQHVKTSFQLSLLKGSNISFVTALFTASSEVSTFRYLAQATNNGTLGSFSNRTPTSLVLLHTTYTCAFKPGCLMSHCWLHTPDCKL